MDVSEIKKKLESLQKKKKPYKKIDYSKIFWKPTVGKHLVRVVPSKFNSKNPFMEGYFYYNIGNKVMISPTTFNEEDPIKQFTQKLRESNEKENWTLAGKLSPKLRVFAPVVVRGEEDKGVRWWEFGKNIYLEFLSMADDEDIGDYTDVAEGRDFTVETVGPEVTGTKYNKSTLRPRTKTTPLSESAEVVKQWLEDQPNPLEVYKRWTFDEMKDALQKWLTPEEDEEEIIDEGNDDFEDEQEEIKPKKTTFTPPTKVNKQNEFNKLFEEGEENQADDMPF